MFRELLEVLKQGRSSGMAGDHRALSIVEYIVGGALILAIIAIAVAGIARSTGSTGSEVKGAIDNLPAQPAWP